MLWNVEVNWGPRKRRIPVPGGEVGRRVLAADIDAELGLRTCGHCSAALSTYRRACQNLPWTSFSNPQVLFCVPNLWILPRAPCSFMRRALTGVLWAFTRATTDCHLYRREATWPASTWNWESECENVQDWPHYHQYFFNFHQRSMVHDRRRLSNSNRTKRACASSTRTAKKSLLYSKQRAKIMSPSLLSLPPLKQQTKLARRCPWPSSQQRLPSEIHIPCYKSDTLHTRNRNKSHISNESVITWSEHKDGFTSGRNSKTQTKARPQQ